jgi:uncharacterized membrane protein
MKKLQIILLQAIVSLIPVFYLLMIWNNLPESVPLHYDGQGKAKSFGSKPELLAVLLFMFAISVGMSLLLININKIDPKKRFPDNSKLPFKISWVVIIFITLMSTYIVYDTENYIKTNGTAFSVKYIMVLSCLLIAILGNFMNNIKPNYFVGIRTPWALEDEENWRLTHRLGSKIWFFGGLAMMILMIVLPDSASEYVMLGGLIPLVGIPFWYSYNIFSKKRKQRKSG